MNAFLALLAFLQTTAPHAEQVRIPGPGGVTLQAVLVLPEGRPVAPAIVALHGCGGPSAARDGSWAITLARQRHIVLLPDSFGSRGLGSQCRIAHRSVTPSGLRRQDAIAAASWLAARPGTPKGGIALMGWSNGGGTVLAAANQAADPPAGLFSRFVAFYPGCATRARDEAWRPSAPVMILVGDADDWTPAAPCRALASRFAGEITLHTYPGAYHDFDAPDRPVRDLKGLATPPSGTGRAHTGTNPAARADALRVVPEFLQGSP
jgi:dienelactone hydrolase